MFAAISRLSPEVAAGYERAGSKEIKDLELGSCHIYDTIPGNKSVALLIAQKRREALNIGAFESCLNHLAAFAKETKGEFIFRYFYSLALKEQGSICAFPKELDFESELVSNRKDYFKMASASWYSYLYLLFPSQKDVCRFTVYISASKTKDSGGYITESFEWKRVFLVHGRRGRRKA